MSRILLERYPETPYPTPMDYDLWMEVNHALDPCLEAREAHWIRSFVSSDGKYSICEFEVPYAEAVREACREAGFTFEKVWRAEVLTDSPSKVFNNQKSLFLGEIINEPTMTPEIWDLSREKAQFSLREHNIDRLYTWRTADHQRSIYCFQAVNAEDIRTAFRQADMTFNNIWKAYLIESR
jgi:hypothetical protein